MFAWLFSASSHADDLTVGQAAPDFKLVDQAGKTQQLSLYAGKWIVLYFYPKDDTPGCTEEACHFRDDISQLQRLGVQVLGVSLDSAASHAKFSEKHGLPFPLLADTDGTVCAAYQALFSLGPLQFAKRHSFIINPQGRIARIYRKVDTATHSTDIINAVKELQATYK
jgi:thioredoxin-dependent peroxiredoxin